MAAADRARMVDGGIDKIFLVEHDEEFPDAVFHTL